MSRLGGTTLSLMQGVIFLMLAPLGVSTGTALSLAFLWFAFDPATKRFRNCLSYERQWQ